MQFRDKKREIYPKHALIYLLQSHIAHFIPINPHIIKCKKYQQKVHATRNRCELFGEALKRKWVLPESSHLPINLDDSSYKRVKNQCCEISIIMLS